VTVYVDNARIPATVGSTKALWCHLTADTEEELHKFAEHIGLRREWFQSRCRTKCSREGEKCPHWHYDVVYSRRISALASGAKSVTLRELGDIIRQRREQSRGTRTT